jgi:hypothetical protein
MKLKISVFFFGLLYIFCISAESFVQPKKKAPSCNTSKEACAQVGGQILAAIPGVLEGIAEVQRIVVRMENQLLEGDKKSFMAKASKEQLHEYHQILQHIQQEQERFHRSMYSAHQRLKNLEAQVMSKS